MTPDLPPFDPLDPDAPLVQLLSVSSNPILATCSDEELRAVVIRLRQVATSPPTLSSKLAKDSDKIKSVRASSKRQSILDAL